MNLKFDDMILKNGLRISDMNEYLPLFITTTINDNDSIILRSKKPKELCGARFRVNIWFVNGVVERVCLIAANKQDNPEFIKYSEVDELHKYWLEKNYGIPSQKKLYGNIYEFEDFNVCSEYDPRSGSSEIIYTVK